MASVVSTSACRRICCATLGCTRAFASRVAQVWRSEWKESLRGRGRSHSVCPSLGQRRCVRSAALYVSATGLAAALLVALDDAGAAESSTQARGDVEFEVASRRAWERATRTVT